MMHEKLPLLIALVVGVLLAALLMWPTRPDPVSSAIHSTEREGSTRSNGRPPTEVEASPRRPGAAVAHAPARSVVEAQEPVDSPEVQAAIAELQPVAWEPTHAGIDSGLGDLQPVIDRCFAPWKAEEPEINGEMTMKLRASANPELPGEGRIELMELKTEAPANPAFRICLERALGALRLSAPPAEGEMDFDYPMQLHAQ